MNYVIEINIQTDGDFSFKYVPAGMTYDGCFRYKYIKTFNDLKKAVSHAVEISNFLTEHLYTTSNYVKNYWHRAIEAYLNQIQKINDTDSNKYIIEEISGNYEGTEFTFQVKPIIAKFDFTATDEEWALINKVNNSKNPLVRLDIKEAILNLYRKRAETLNESIL